MNIRAVLLLIAVVVASSSWAWQELRLAPWTEAEIGIIESLSLDSLGEVPPDPSNAVADNPLAIEFGRALFFDTRFSANGNISCATCHQPPEFDIDAQSLNNGFVRPSPPGPGPSANSNN